MILIAGADLWNKQNLLPATNDFSLFILFFSILPPRCMQERTRLLAQN
jgi:hypothetical protein